MILVQESIYQEFNLNKIDSGLTTTEDQIRLLQICDSLIFVMDFSLLSPLEFFVDPKNGDGGNNKPPAMRVRVDCYTKKLPFRVQ